MIEVEVAVDSVPIKAEVVTILAVDATKVAPEVMETVTEMKAILEEAVVIVGDDKSLSSCIHNATV